MKVPAPPPFLVMGPGSKGRSIIFYTDRLFAAVYLR